jgi:hypothetical protein
MQQIGDISHYISRLTARREHHEVSVYNDLSVISYQKTVATLESQQGLTVKRHGYQKKLQDTRERYHLNREHRMQQIKQYRANNPEKVKQWRKKNNEKNKDYQAQWRKKNSKKCTRYAYKYRNKKLAAMTPDQQKEYKKQQYQQNRERMIEKHGLDGWRAICNERTKKAREKKRDKNSKSA